MQMQTFQSVEVCYEAKQPLLPPIKILFWGVEEQILLFLSSTP